MSLTHFYVLISQVVVAGRVCVVGGVVIWGGAGGGVVEWQPTKCPGSGVRVGVLLATPGPRRSNQASLMSRVSGVLLLSVRPAIHWPD